MTSVILPPPIGAQNRIVLHVPDDHWEPLADSFGRRHNYLRLSITDRCNFRCQYCMPQEKMHWMPKDELLTFEEIERLVWIFSRLGIDKVRVTGGEPTIRKNYDELLHRILAIPRIDSVHLTTNGHRLEKDAERLTAAGLSSVNVSLDTLRPERFFDITQRDEFSNVMAGIQAAIKCGLSTKVNVVLLPGVNDDEVLDFVEFVRERPITVRFIEFMPFLATSWSPSRVVASKEIRKLIAEKYTLTALPSEINDVATEYEIKGCDGRIGFVSSVTESFCEGCNRIRLTADGQIKNCLFLPPERSLRDQLRSGKTDDEIAMSIRQSLQTKWSGHPEMNRWRQLDSLAMVQIGG